MSHHARFKDDQEASIADVLQRLVDLRWKMFDRAEGVKQGATDDALDLLEIAYLQAQVDLKREQGKH